MKKILIVSVVLNVLLVVTIAVGYWQCRIAAFQMVADSTSYDITLQENILRELESADPKRIDAVKTRLSRNIESGRKALTAWVTAR